MGNPSLPSMVMSWVRLGMVAVVLASCSALPNSIPEVVATRHRLPACGEPGEVFLPIQQGPEATRGASLAAIACFQSNVAAQRGAELEFTLLGIEGQQFRAILQVLDDGTVNYFREVERGWEFHLGCSDFSMPAPGIPRVANCTPDDVTP